MNAHQAAEAIQSRFTRNDDDEVVACSNRYMSDILGSDWASGKNFDNSTPQACRTSARVLQASLARFSPLFSLMSPCSLTFFFLLFYCQF